MFAVMNYGADWRQHRRAFHQEMDLEVMAEYEHIQLQAERNLLRSVLRSPQNMKDHLITCVCWIVAAF